tara:strand:- start:7119 stop:7544 length:426 start_codon:yes stop_codon:yes gene_type:complete
MYSKVLFLLIGAFTWLIPINAIALDLNSCRTYKRNVGIDSKLVDEGIEIIATSEVKVESDYKEDVIKSLSEAEAISRIKILRFLRAECIDDKCFHPYKMSDPPKLDKQLRSMVTISQCYQSNKFVRVSVELSPKTIKLNQQ